MVIFTDTSGLFALIDADDVRHEDATRIFARLQTERASLLTHSYVVVECTALLQTRAGVGAAARLNEDLLDLLDVRWVDAELHTFAWAALRAAGRRAVSLVDHVSFELMRRHGVQAAFAFDAHLTEEGFELLAA